MTANYAVPQTGDSLFEAFIEQVKQILEHLYDFAYLQQHPLARFYDGENELSARTAGRQLRYELITAIESLKPFTEHFRAPDARLYNILHLHYVENLAIQDAAIELGLSERQTYRDLKRGQEHIASVLWSKRLPPSVQNANLAHDTSLESELTRLTINLGKVDIGGLFQQAKTSVERLAMQQPVRMVVEENGELPIVWTDAALGHQVIVSLLSHAIQQAQPESTMVAQFSVSQHMVMLNLQYSSKNEASPAPNNNPAVIQLTQRLRWTLSYGSLSDNLKQVSLQITSSNPTILIIDDNQGWVDLLERFLEDHACLTVAARHGDEGLRLAQELKPSVIILDVMMPGKDGWELLQRLRAQPDMDNVPIVVCTVFNDAQLAYSLGASAFLAKPTSREKVLEALKGLHVI